MPQGRDKEKAWPKMLDLPEIKYQCVLMQISFTQVRAFGIQCHHKTSFSFCLGSHGIR